MRYVSNVPKCAQKIPPVDKKADKGLDAGQLDISLDLLRPAKSRRQMQPRNFMNVAPLQLGEEVFCIHSARLDESLVTASPHLDARGLKTRAASKTTVEGSRWKFLEAPFPLA